MTATLVFAHGNGFCKQMWRPIIRQIQQSQFAAQVTAGAGFECHETCLPLHGEKHDPHVHEGATVHYLDGDKSRPRVDFPTDWPIGFENDIFPEIKALRDRCDSGEQRRPLIGIGHSLGAGQLWTVEARHPGTFDGLILFEPPFVEHTPTYKKSIDFLVSVTLQREHEWSSKEAARAFFESYKNFASWDREVLHHYVDGAIVSSEGESKVRLAYHPLAEATIYGNASLDLSEDELASPKCPVYFHHGDKTRIFDVPTFQALADRHPQIYRVCDPIPGSGHLMVVEDLDMSVNAILDGLKTLLVDKAAESVASRL